jgi:hypothetical protein
MSKLRSTNVLFPNGFATLSRRFDDLMASAQNRLLGSRDAARVHGHPYGQGSCAEGRVNKVSGARSDSTEEWSKRWSTAQTRALARIEQGRHG